MNKLSATRPIIDAPLALRATRRPGGQDGLGSAREPFAGDEDLGELRVLPHPPKGCEMTPTDFARFPPVGAGGHDQDCRGDVGMALDDRSTLVPSGTALLL